MNVVSELGSVVTTRCGKSLSDLSLNAVYSGRGVYSHLLGDTDMNSQP